MTCSCKHFLCFREAKYFVRVSKETGDSCIDSCCTEHYLEILDVETHCCVVMMSEKEFKKLAS